MKKYKIEECMHKLNLKEYKFASHAIPKILGIAFNTFHNYRKIKYDSSQDIPYEKVILMEHLFGLAAGKLTNQILSTKSLREHFNAHNGH